MDFKDHWDLDTAMQILQNKTVDSKLWAEAVEWLLLYGPPEIVAMLLKASGQATDTTFPELQPTTYTHDGQPFYNVKEIAITLGLSEDEVREIISRKENLTERTHFFSGNGSETIH